MSAPTYEARAGDGWEMFCASSTADFSVSRLGRIDHVIMDPPFTQRVSEGARSATGLGDRIIAFDGIDGQEARLMRLALEAARGWVVTFCACEQLGAYEAADPQRWMRAGAWHKPDATPQFTGDRPGTFGEALGCAWAGDGRSSWNGGGRPLYYSVRRCSGRERLTEPHPKKPGKMRPVHATQKPVALMEAILRDFTDPGDLICDPFAGLGSTGVAALRLGRRFVGWEMDPRYFDLATKRLESTREQRDLFSAARLPGKQTGLGFGP